MEQMWGVGCVCVCGGGGGGRTCHDSVRGIPDRGHEDNRLLKKESSRSEAMQTFDWPAWLPEELHVQATSSSGNHAARGAREGKVVRVPVRGFARARACVCVCVLGEVVHLSISPAGLKDANSRLAAVPSADVDLRPKQRWQPMRSLDRQHKQQRCSMLQRRTVRRFAHLAADPQAGHFRCQPRLPGALTGAVSRGFKGVSCTAQKGLCSIGTSSALS